MNLLKTCANDPRHVWMADISLCPYCNNSRAMRVEMAAKAAAAERAKRKESTKTTGERGHVIGV